MSYIYYNPNPMGKKTTDCVIRMLTRIYGMSWEEAYLALSEVVLAEYEMPSSNYIWEKYLKTHGFKKRLLPSDCPDCISVRGFAERFNHDIYAACTGSHVVAVVDGDYFDAWNSGDEVVTYFFERRQHVSISE